jgi:hypothetical protein
MIGKRHREDHKLAEWVRTHRMVITAKGLDPGTVLDMPLETLLHFTLDVTAANDPAGLRVRILEGES